MGSEKYVGMDVHKETISIADSETLLLQNASIRVPIGVHQRAIQLRTEQTREVRDQRFKFPPSQ